MAHESPASVMLRRGRRETTRISETFLHWCSSNSTCCRRDESRFQRFDLAMRVFPGAMPQARIESCAGSASRSLQNRGGIHPCQSASFAVKASVAAKPPWAGSAVATAKKLPECIDAELLKMWRHKVRRRRNHARPCPRPHFRLAPPSGRWPSSWAVAQAPVCFR